jgi:hypothetical protein
MSTTEWKFPGTCANVDRDSGKAWKNPSNADADDGSVAKTQYELQHNDWLKVTNFGFDTGDIPADTTSIDGIEVQIERKVLADYGTKDDSFRLLDGDGNVDGG